MAIILVVDDSRFTRGRICRPLVEAGHEVLQADDGLAGLKTLESKTPDVVLTDLLMPNLDGVAFLKAVRQQHGDLPVVVVSADIQESSRQACLELDCSGFLNKPAKPAEILQAIDQVLGVHEPAST